MPLKNLKSAICGLHGSQRGSAFKETVLLLTGLTMVSIIVTYVFLGSSIFASGKDVTDLSNPAAYKTSPGVFTPITDLEKIHEGNPERIYSTVKGAIADLEDNSSDNVSFYNQLISK